jgi:hypothetical protein
MFIIIPPESKDALLGTLPLLLLLPSKSGSVTFCLAFRSAAAPITILRFRFTAFGNVSLFRRGFGLLNGKRLGVRRNYWLRSLSGNEVCWWFLTC